MTYLEFHVFGLHAMHASSQSLFLGLLPKVAKTIDAIEMVCSMKIDNTHSSCGFVEDLCVSP